MTTITIVQQVEKWYADHSAALGRRGARTSVQSIHPSDVMRGLVEIRVETALVLASVSFWNDGNVSAFAVDKQSKAERSLDDRPLQTQDHVPALLDMYFNEIIPPQS